MKNLDILHRRQCVAALKKMALDQKIARFNFQIDAVKIENYPASLNFLLHKVLLPVTSFCGSVALQN